MNFIGSFFTIAYSSMSVSPEPAGNPYFELATTDDFLLSDGSKLELAT